MAENSVEAVAAGAEETVAEAAAVEKAAAEATAAETASTGMMAADEAATEASAAKKAATDAEAAAVTAADKPAARAAAAADAEAAVAEKDTTVAVAAEKPAAVTAAVAAADRTAVDTAVSQKAAAETAVSEAAAAEIVAAEVLAAEAEPLAAEATLAVEVEHLAAEKAKAEGDAVQKAEAEADAVQKAEAEADAVQKAEAEGDAVQKAEAEQLVASAPIPAPSATAPGSVPIAQSPSPAPAPAPASATAPSVPVPASMPAPALPSSPSPAPPPPPPKAPLRPALIEPPPPPPNAPLPTALRGAAASESGQPSMPCQIALDSTAPAKPAHAAAVPSKANLPGRSRAKSQDAVMSTGAQAPASKRSMLAAEAKAEWLAMEREMAAKGLVRLEPLAAASTGAELRLTAKNLSKKVEIEGAKAAGGHIDEAARARDEAARARRAQREAESARACARRAKLAQESAAERVMSLPSIKREPFIPIDQARPWRRAVLQTPRYPKPMEGSEPWREPPRTPLYVPMARSASAGLLPPLGLSTTKLPPQFGGGPRATSILMMHWQPGNGWDQATTKEGPRNVGWLMGTHLVPVNHDVLPSTAQIHWGDRSEFLVGRADAWLLSPRQPVSHPGPTSPRLGTLHSSDAVRAVDVD